MLWSKGVEEGEEDRRLPVGSYTAEFTKRKRWTVSEPLLEAIKYVLEDTIGVPVASDASLSVNDLGAGTGLYVKRLREWGYKAMGYDSIPGIWELSWGLVKELDLTAVGDGGNGPFPSLASLCIEVGEHIPERESQRLLNCISITTVKCAIISWAVLGQRGRGHINCHTPEWVVCQMAKWGRDWTFDEERTVRARKICDREYSHKLLVFHSV